MRYKNIAGRFFGLVTKDAQTDGRTDGQNYNSEDRAKHSSRGKNEKRARSMSRCVGSLRLGMLLEQKICQITAV